MTVCIDCRAEGVTTNRPIVSGKRTPRCATHHRSRRKAAQTAAHGYGLQTRHRMTPEQYQKLYEAQGGVCPICRIATGKSKKLAVDHDHACTAGHPPDQSCPRCWRGLLCGRCNQWIGWNPPEVLVRALEYQLDPPARRVFA